MNNAVAKRTGNVLCRSFSDSKLRQMMVLALFHFWPTLGIHSPSDISNSGGSICSMNDSSYSDTFTRRRPSGFRVSPFLRAMRACVRPLRFELVDWTNKVANFRILLRSRCCRNPIQRDVHRSIRFLPSSKKNNFNFYIHIFVSIAVCSRCSCTYLHFIPRASLFFRFRAKFIPPGSRSCLCHCIFNFPLERVLHTARVHKFRDSATFFAASFQRRKYIQKFFCSSRQPDKYFGIHELQPDNGNEMEAGTGTGTHSHVSDSLFAHIRSAVWFFCSRFRRSNKIPFFFFSPSSTRNGWRTPHSKLKWKFYYANAVQSSHCTLRGQHEIHANCEWRWISIDVNCQLRLSEWMHKIHAE